MKEVLDSDLKPNAMAQLVMAGARSVALATQVLVYVHLERRDPGADAAVAGLAKLVLADWGIGGLPSGPESPAAPDAPEPELRWPPPEPALPGVFMENFYSVREAVVGANIFSDDDVIELSPDNLLRFTGKAFWQSTSSCWMFRMTRDGDSGALTTWVRSSVLKPGDEIPMEDR
jgi:hypothetical protein